MRNAIQMFNIKKEKLGEILFNFNQWLSACPWECINESNWLPLA